MPPLGGSGLEGVTSGAGGGGGVPDDPFLLQGFGVVGAPALAFLGDEDTGLYRNAADSLSLVAGGVEAFRLTEGEGSINSNFAGRLEGFVVGSAAIRSVAASGTVPTLNPSKTNLTTGIGANASAELSLIADGVEGFRVTEAAAVITNTIFGNLVAAGGGGAGPAMLNVSASPTVPTFVPNQADPDTGLTRDAVNGLSMVAGGLGCIRARNIGSARAVGFYTTTPIVQQTGVAVTDVAIHAALVALGLITA